MRLKMLLTLVVISFITLKAFAANNKIDYAGYYIPAKEFYIGNFHLDYIAVAHAMDVLSYKSCTLRSKSSYPNYAPVIFEFSDVTSQKKVNTIGQYYYVNSPRVLPQTCQISGNKLSFLGKDKQIGKISFTGTLELHALKGDLMINGKTYKNIEFSWFGGD